MSSSLLCILLLVGFQYFSCLYASGDPGEMVTLLYGYKNVKIALGNVTRLVEFSLILFIVLYSTECQYTQSLGPVHIENESVYSVWQ